MPNRPKTTKKAVKKPNSEPDAIDFLKSQHRDVEKLFAQLEETGSRALKKRAALFEEIAHKLTCHAELEETIFYPEGKEVVEDMTLEAYEEHDIVKSLIAKIGATDPSDETFMAKCTVLKEVVEHHVEEEEEEFFPKLRKELGKERLMELAEELKAAFDELSDSLKPEAYLGGDSTDRTGRASPSESPV